MTILNQSMMQEQNFVTRILIDSFIIYMKIEDFFEDISIDVERWIDIPNYNDKRSLPIRIKKCLVFSKMK